MKVHRHERAIPDDIEAVNLAGLDDENIPSAAFLRTPVSTGAQTSLRSRSSSPQGLQVQTLKPDSAAFPDKLDLIVRMPMRPRTLARQPAEQKHGDTHASLLGPDKFV
jgi:hypothetical protein